MYICTYFRKIQSIMARKIYITAAFFALAMMVNAQSWLKTLRNENEDIIDSIVVAEADKGWADYLNMYSYHIYYHQPLTHKNPDGEQFQLRATLVVRKNKSVATTPMQVFFSGYDIHKYNWDNPSYYVGQGSIATDFFELSNHLKSNVLSCEHRYFGGSLPKNGNQRMEYCTAEEAAADFHALINAIKKVFKGKYIISGISKGGTTTFLQHAFYPDDADVYVPYVAPLCDTPDDARVMRYYKSHGWDKNMHKRINDIQREMLTQPEVYKFVGEWQKTYNPSWTTLVNKQTFLNKVGVLDFETHMNMSREDVNNMLDNIDSMKKTLLQRGYSNAYLLANIAFYGTLDTKTCWEWLLNQANTRANTASDTASAYPIPANAEERKVPVPFSIASNIYDNSVTAYYYQAVSELGSFGYDFHAILGDEYAELADSINAVWRKSNNNSIYTTMSYFKPVKYDSSLRDMVIEKTKHSTKPIIFLFGEDDAWTGGGLPEECYNNETTFKVILSRQNHSACISNALFSERNNAWSLIDDAMSGKLVSDIKSVGNDSHDSAIYNLNGQRVKVMERGKIYIVNGKKVIKN